MNSFKRPTFNELHMANQENLLDQRLAQVEDRAQRIPAAAQEPVERARDNEQWWAHMVNYFGSEAVMFERCCIDRRVFDEVYALVRDSPGPARGRRGVIQTTGRNSGSHLSSCQGALACSRSWLRRSSRTGST